MTRGLVHTIAALAPIGVLGATSVAAAQTRTGDDVQTRTGDDVQTPTSDAPAPAATPPEKPRLVSFELQGGLGSERFTGLVFKRYDIGALLKFRPAAKRYEAALDLRFQPGVTEFGLTSYRHEAGASFGNRGRLRFSGGPHLAYTMVLRATRSSAFSSALFGDIAGLGVGVHGAVTLDLVEDDTFALLVGARGTAEVFDSNTGYGGNVFLGVALGR